MLALVLLIASLVLATITIAILIRVNRSLLATVALQNGAIAEFQKVHDDLVHQTDLLEKVRLMHKIVHSLPIKAVKSQFVILEQP